MRLTPAERSVQNRINANKRWAKVLDRTAETAAARRKSPSSMEYWLKLVDPDEVMSERDRKRAANNAKTAHFDEFALQGRRAKASKAA